jgi:hypothetical protein
VMLRVASTEHILNRGGIGHQHEHFQSD